MYYKISDFLLKGFQKSTRKGKMYDAILQNKNSKKIIKVPFGDNSMGNYGDKTGLNLYPQLIHRDPKRRSAFHSRFFHLLKEGFYSAGYFSFYYLW
jgi:hypothetical protein